MVQSRYAGPSTADGEHQCSRLSSDLLHACPQVRFAHLLHGVEAFDARAFGTDGTEASLMDPQQRLMLECVAEAVLTQRPVAMQPGFKAGQVRLAVVLGGCLALVPHAGITLAGSAQYADIYLAGDALRTAYNGCPMRTRWCSATRACT